MATGDILRATLVGTFDGEPINMDLGFVSASGATDWPGEADGLNAEIVTALVLNDYTSAFFAPLSSKFTLDSVRIQDLAPGVSAGREYGVGIPGFNAVDDALPPQTAICVTWRTDLKGKANRGRTYLGGLAEDSQNAGYWIPEIQTWAFTAFAQPLLDAFGVLGTGNYALSVVHTQAGGVRLHPPTATPITSFTVHNDVRTLRRRGVGVRISRHRTAP